MKILAVLRVTLALPAPAFLRPIKEHFQRWGSPSNGDCIHVALLFVEFLRWDNFIRVDPAVPQGCTQPYGMELVVGTLVFVPFVQGMCGAGNMLEKGFMHHW